MVRRQQAFLLQKTQMSISYPSDPVRLVVCALVYMFSVLAMEILGVLAFRGCQEAHLTPGGYNNMEIDAGGQGPTELEVRSSFRMMRRHWIDGIEQLAITRLPVLEALAVNEPGGLVLEAPVESNRTLSSIRDVHLGGFMQAGILRLMRGE